MDIELIDNIKLVALFVGWEDDGEKNSLNYYGDVDVYLKSTGHFADMEFTSSWDWIIPVYYKLCTLAWYEGASEMNNIKVFTDEFHTRIMRDAPSEAFGILVQFLNWYIEKQETAKTTESC
jgi:hypothetical protein